MNATVFVSGLQIGLRRFFATDGDCDLSEFVLAVVIFWDEPQVDVKGVVCRSIPTTSEEARTTHIVTDRATIVWLI
jgi:hypothetical protein